MYLLIVFFVGAFAYTWAFHLQIVRNRWSIDRDPGRRLYWLGLPGPTLAALAISVALGSTDILLERLLIRPIGLQWWLLAFLAVPTTYIVATGLYSIRTKQRPARLFRRPSRGWRAALFSQVVVVSSEEIGWRGFALPLLIQQFGSLGGTLILGPVWALWHLPMFRVPSSHQEGSFWKFVYGLTIWTVIMTATFTGSGGSILPAMLLHATANLAYFVMDVPTGAEPYSAVILGLIAVFVVFLFPDPLIALSP